MFGELKSHKILFETSLEVHGPLWGEIFVTMYNWMCAYAWLNFRSIYFHTNINQFCTGCSPRERQCPCKGEAKQEIWSHSQNTDSASPLQYFPIPCSGRGTLGIEFFTSCWHTHSRQENCHPCSEVNWFSNQHQKYLYSKQMTQL